MPDGGYLYPNGQDWQLHRNPQWIDNHAGNAILFNDAEAARLMLICLDCLEKMQARNSDGSVFLPEEFSFPPTQSGTAEILANVRHLLAEYGTGAPAASEETLLKNYSGRHVFEAGKFALLRTTRSVSSFSWGSQPMGMVMPLDKDLLLSPNERSLIGTVLTVNKTSEKPVVQEVNLTSTTMGFGVSGILSRAGGEVEQRFAFAALPDGRTVYILSLIHI